MEAMETHAGILMQLFETPDRIGSRTSDRGNGKTTYQLLSTSRLYAVGKDYSQPPYKPGDDFLPMYLMVHGELDCEKDFETIKKRIHKEVYGVKEAQL